MKNSDFSRRQPCEYFVTTATLLLALLISGCMGGAVLGVIQQDIELRIELRDVLRLKEQGTGRVYEVTPDQAWEIARAVFRWEEADPAKENRDSGYMLLRKVGHPGMVMGAWIDQADGGTKVTVVKRRIEKKGKVAFSETIFHRRFAQAVEIIKKGEDLPDLPPD